MTPTTQHTGPDFTVSWVKRWNDKPLQQPETCRHGGDRCLTIDQHIEKRGKRDVIVLAGNVCMDCGIDTTGQLDRVQALSECWREHGWHRETGLRLYDLAEHHRSYFMKSAAVPIWFAHAWDIPPQKIAEALSRTAIAGPTNARSALSRASGET